MLNTKSIIDTRIINTAIDLQIAVDKFNVDRPDVINVENADGEPVTISLIEETLTDGSKVYNLRVS